MSRLSLVANPPTITTNAHALAGILSDALAEGLPMPRSFSGDNGRVAPYSAGLTLGFTKAADLFAWCSWLGVDMPTAAVHPSLSALGWTITVQYDDWPVRLMVVTEVSS